MEKLATAPGEALSVHVYKKLKKLEREKLRKSFRKSQGKFKKILGKIGPSILPPKPTNLQTIFSLIKKL
jgi:hypothetical protein